MLLCVSGMAGVLRVVFRMIESAAGVLEPLHIGEFSFHICTPRNPAALKFTAAEL